MATRIRWRSGAEGTALGALDRHDGIAVRNDRLFVVERINRRVQVLALPSLQPISSFGADVLHQVESIYGDPEYNRLLLADESEQDRDIKLYNLQGEFSGEALGQGRFRFEPEGIALYRCAEGAGYLFTTDQDEKDNRFDVYDRKSLAYIGSFQGAVTRNIDGVALTQRAMPGFPKGAFFAVHDDGNVGAFDLAGVLDTLGVAACEAPE